MANEEQSENQLSDWFQRTLKLRKALLEKPELIKDILKIDAVHYATVRIHHPPEHIKNSDLLQKRCLGTSSRRSHYKTKETKLSGFDNPYWDLVLYHTPVRLSQKSTNKIDRKELSKVSHIHLNEISPNLVDLLFQFAGMEKQFELHRLGEEPWQPPYVAAVLLTPRGFTILKEDLTKAKTLRYHELNGTTMEVHVPGEDEPREYRFDYDDYEHLDYRNGLKYFHKDVRADLSKRVKTSDN